MDRVVRLRTHYYQQFDADYTREVPAEGYGGWQVAELPLSGEHSALVVMHAWDCGTYEEFPGWWRAVEYIPRSIAICRTVFPPVLSAARETGFRVFHVVGGGTYYQSLPGYQRAVALAGAPPPPPEQAATDPVLEELRAFRNSASFVGEGNREDTAAGFARVDFAPEARPQGDEGVAENAAQLLALCREAGVNHLIYMGFAINWCLLMSPGGMLEMSKHGIMCSILSEATCAVENRETGREELNKAEGLWRTALAFGFVYEVKDFVQALRGQGR